VNGPRLFRARRKISTSSSTNSADTAQRSSRPIDRTDFETISDLMSGQHSDPLRVIMFDPAANRSEDVSHAIAREILRRFDLEADDVPSELEGIIDQHVGPDRQRTLRLALA
jgi:hypothetical protein